MVMVMGIITAMDSACSVFRYYGNRLNIISDKGNVKMKDIIKYFLPYNNRFVYYIYTNYEHIVRMFLVLGNTQAV